MREVVPGNVRGGGAAQKVAAKIIDAPAVQMGVHNFKQSDVPVSSPIAQTRRFGHEWFSCGR